MSASTMRERWGFAPRVADNATVEITDDQVYAIPHPRPDWIFFDVGLTFIHPSCSLIREALATAFPAHSWTAREILGSLVSAAEGRHIPWPSNLSGDNRVERAWAALLRLPLAEGAAILSACLARKDLYCEVDPTAGAVFEELSHRGVRIGALSNSDGSLEEELAHFGLASHFDLVIDSGQVGVEKPHPAIFRAALDRAGIRAEAAWHIGDGLINDYLAASAVGMAPILLDRHGTYAAVPAHRMSRLDQVLGLPAFTPTSASDVPDCSRFRRKGASA